MMVPVASIVLYPHHQRLLYHHIASTLVYCTPKPSLHPTQFGAVTPSRIFSITGVSVMSLPHVVVVLSLMTNMVLVHSHATVDPFLPHAETQLFITIVLHVGSFKAFGTIPSHHPAGFNLTEPVF